MRGLDAMPGSLDSSLTGELDGQRVIDDLFEGLTTIGIDGGTVPGVAASWEVSADGKTWLPTSNLTTRSFASCDRICGFTNRCSLGRAGSGTIRIHSPFCR